MKRLLFLGLVLSAFVGCSKKDIVKWLGKPHTGKPPVPCLLDSIYPIEPVNFAAGRTTAVGIHYNDKGNPVVANYTFLHYGTYQFPVYYRYDSKDRLIEILPPSNESVPEYLNGVPYRTKYVYNGNSMVPVRDTIFYPNNTSVLAIEDLYYDKQGRVNRVLYRYPQGSPLADFETKYVYDAQGNKQVSLSYDGSTPAPLVYNNKPSLYSLHPVWKIIHKDYSKNSLGYQVAAYTEYGLPFKLTNNTISGYYGYEVHEASGFFVFLGVESSIELNLSYNCYGSSK